MLLMAYDLLWLKSDLKLILLADLFINYNCQLLKICRKTTNKPASASKSRISLCLSFWTPGVSFSILSGPSSLYRGAIRVFIKEFATIYQSTDDMFHMGSKGTVGKKLCSFMAYLNMENLVPFPSVQCK